MGERHGAPAVEINGATRVVGVIGDPVAHSLSPAIHNAAFAERGLNWAYAAFPVRRGDGGRAVEAARALGLAGLNVTMPHKEDVAGACDELTPDAAALRSVNTVVVGAEGRTSGHSTDGAGFLASLAEEGVAVDGVGVLVLGAGGAGRAVALALARAGARVTVAARRPAAAAAAARLAQGRAVVLDGPLGDVIGGCAVVVNATPVGMGAAGGSAPPIDPSQLFRGQVVVDLVYDPRQTPLLREAAARGCRTVGGLGMLVHQAALAFSLWTGAEAPLPVMRRAAEAALSGGAPEVSPGAPSL